MNVVRGSLPAPIAKITVALPVTMSPPAQMRDCRVGPSSFVWHDRGSDRVHAADRPPGVVCQQSSSGPVTNPRRPAEPSSVATMCWWNDDSLRHDSWQHTRTPDAFEASRQHRELIRPVISTSMFSWTNSRAEPLLPLPQGGRTRGRLDAERDSCDAVSKITKYAALEKLGSSRLVRSGPEAVTATFMILVAPFIRRRKTTTIHTDTANTVPEDPASLAVRHTSLSQPSTLSSATHRDSSPRHRLNPCLAGFFCWLRCQRKRPASPVIAFTQRSHGNSMH